ncbi:Vacuolar protease A [Thoreauomyces humboldtii]|nr:Vacuolar protease A [Thoreauomyces humboldtii]
MLVSIVGAAFCLVSVASAAPASGVSHYTTGTKHVPVKKGPHHGYKPWRFPGQEPVTYSSLENGAYYGEVEVGTPAQKFSVLLDTGSSDFWLYADGGHKKKDSLYYPGASKTNKDAHKVTHIGYGDGSVAQFAWQNDTIKFAGKHVKTSIGAALLSLNNVTHAEATSATNHGLMGLSWQDGNTANYRPPVQQMAADGIIPRSMFGLYLGNEKNSTDGQLTIGGVDPKHFVVKDLAWNPSPVAFNNPKYGHNWWNIYVDEIKVGHWSNKTTRSDTHGKGGDAEYILDSGTSFLSLPTPLVDKLVAITDAKLVSASTVTGGYAVDCKHRKTAPKLTFVIGGKPYTLNADEWIGMDAHKVEVPGTTCFLEVYDNGLSPPNILGGPFLRKFYSVYDFDHSRTGLARAVHRR